MDNLYMLPDTEITKGISKRLKALRLKQNISRQALARSSGVSLSSIARMEDGEIKSFDSLLRILRTLGELEVFLPLVKEEAISPNAYFKLVHAAEKKRRKRASHTNPLSAQEEVVW